jgi:hypothetical protein
MDERPTDSTIPMRGWTAAPGSASCPSDTLGLEGSGVVMTRLTAGNPARRTAGRICSFALLVAMGAALLPAAPVAAAPPPNRSGEVLGRATRSAAPTSPAVAAAVPSGLLHRGGLP